MDVSDVEVQQENEDVYCAIAEVRMQILQQRYPNSKAFDPYARAKRPINGYKYDGSR